MVCVAATSAFGPGWAASYKAALRPLNSLFVNFDAIDKIICVDF